MGGDRTPPNGGGRRRAGIVESIPPIARARIGGEVDAAPQLVARDPLGEEVGGHEVVCDLDDAALALGHAALERVVPAEEVARARRGHGIVGDEDVGLVVREDDRGPGGWRSEGKEDDARVRDVLPGLGGLAVAIASHSCDESTIRPTFFVQW